MRRLPGRALVATAMCGGAGLLGFGCGGSTPGSLSAQVTSWARDAGFAASLTRLRADLTRSAQASPGAARRTACDVLVTDSLLANQQLPTPDAELTADLSRAYAGAAGAGRACFSGATGEQTLLTEAERDRSQARTALVVAEARYDAVTSNLPGTAR
ncbi:MAG TPA: hypothetical protein VKR22_06325 [Acidimicrobiales bacterium]|nr:hypothetical protein [Acidimicrobiales bacterium]